MTVLIMFEEIFHALECTKCNIWSFIMHMNVLSFTEVGVYMQPCEDDIVCKCTLDKVPYFNEPIYLENKQKIGKVDEIFGPIRDFVSFCYIQTHTLYLPKCSYYSLHNAVLLITIKNLAYKCTWYEIHWITGFVGYILNPAKCTISHMDHWCYDGFRQLASKL